MSGHLKVTQESHKNVKGKKIEHALSANVLDIGQGITLGNPQDHVPCAKVQALTPGIGR